MNPTKLIRLFILLFAPVLLKAQSITGVINDPSGKGASFASVGLYLAKDSSLVKAAATDGDGKYEIEGIAAGRYFLTASMVGFGKGDSKAFDYNGGALTAEPIALKKAENTLNGITVTTTKPLIEVKADKMIVNVEGSINSTGLDGLELLRKCPGVQVDRDDNVLVQGKQGVKIYIDGKPSPMSGKDLASVLKSMNSADIEAIEIITNPSAKYDAAGNLGIINIRLKKNHKIGTNGNLSINPQFGITPKITLSGSLNYRDNKWNLFGNYSFGEGIYHNTKEDDKIINNIISNNASHSEWRDTSHNFKAGADYFIDAKNTIGFVVNGSRGFHSQNLFSVTQIGNRYASATDSAQLKSSSMNPGKSVNMNYNANYRFADTSGHELTLDADYGTFSGNGFTYQPNYYTFTDPSLAPYTRIYEQQTPTEISIYSFKADYEQKLGKGKLGYGAKASSVKSNNTFDFFDVQNDITLRDTNRSNNFVYTEKIYAAYVNYNTQLTKKWSIQAGLRGEQTTSLGNLTSYKQNALDKVDNSYFDLFPSGALTYQVSKNHSLNLNFSRRISRPSYQDLNPFEFKIDELTYFKGNAFLRPIYTTSVKLTHTFKSILTTSLSYSRSKDDYNDITRIDGNRTYGTLENFSHSQGLYLETSLNTPITKWWEINSSFYFNHNAIHGDFGENALYDVSNNSYGFNGQSTFKLDKTLSFELSGWYNSQFNWIYVNKAMGLMDVGMKKKLWKDAASIKISFSDLLNSAEWSGLFVHNGIYQNLYGHFEARRLQINFDYRFGSSEIKGARNHKSGSEEEAKRIKG